MTFWRNFFPWRFLKKWREALSSHWICQMNKPPARIFSNILAKILSTVFSSFSPKYHQSPFWKQKVLSCYLFTHTNLLSHSSQFGCNREGNAGTLILLFLVFRTHAEFQLMKQFSNHACTSVGLPDTQNTCYSNNDLHFL